MSIVNVYSVSYAAGLLLHSQRSWCKLIFFPLGLLNRVSRLLAGIELTFDFVVNGGRVAWPEAWGQ